MQNAYRPYFEAIEKILRGTPVKELDEIRLQCDKEASPEVSEQTKSYTSRAIMISFVAAAENKILLGEDPVEAYSRVIGIEPAEFRRRGREVLENAVRQYL